MDHGGEAAGLQCGHELPALRLAPRSCGADDEAVGGQGDPGAPRGLAHELRDDRGRAAPALGAHRRARPFGAAEDAEVAVGDCRGGLAPPRVHPHQDGRSDRRTVGR